MSRFKKHLVGFMLCIMLFSVIVPPATAAQEHFSFSAQFERKSIGSDLTMATWYDSLSRLQVSGTSNFIIAAPDKEFTVTNISEAQDCYLVISVTKYAATTAGALREQLKGSIVDSADLKDLPSDDDAPVYFSGYDGRQTCYLSPNGTWRSEIDDGRDPQALRIRHDQTATFTLSDVADNDIVSINIEYFYTSDMGYNTSGLSRSMVLVDTDGVYPVGTAPEMPASDFTFPTLSQLTLADAPPMIAIYSEKSLANSSYVSKIFYTTGSGILVSAPADQEYTVVNTGNRDLTLKLHLYESKPASELRELYYNDDVHRLDSTELPTDDTLIPFCKDMIRNTYYLTTDLVFKNNFSTENDRRILCIKPGETATFSLPETQDGQLWRLTIMIKGSIEFSYNILVSSKPETSIVSSFTDVPANAYYADSVAWAVERGITTGTSETTFSPADTCTTAQILTFLWRAYGQVEPAIANPFTDVTEENYYYKAALWAYENGLVEGDAFNGSAPCTRASVVTYLWKLAGMPEAAPSAFVDVDSGAAYAQAVAWAVSEGITNGTSETTFSPDAICTRAQIVTLLHRALAN